MGRLLDELGRRGALDNTIVVITSHHGELFGEHGLTGHANALYLPLLQVPLVIRYPAKVPGAWRVTEAISLRDLAATIAELAGLPPTPSPGPRSHGRGRPGHLTPRASSYRRLPRGGT
ncbi:MAG: sulfatase-like hydrolase/transferase [Gemmatimonadetes bacterium]|jgi:arylsulfatase A-like enzyme|nr:sulfatase-like hydrolase/transferase [Gemmatimonadota bacterium]MBK6457217.1 sulfatase-like hydrolase/transferase [Gemmatimonadota bacterium]MBK6842426.1 sulfatase-like hydrolase/transferase [Gemmatimonadota bacterium]MBK7830839.1 sulfatase-like hydrolase/transferase [Gemmatimonadota bacterium]